MKKDPNDFTIYDSEFQNMRIDKLKESVGRDAWIVLKKYFNKQAEGTEAKIACVVVGTLAKEMQARNNERQLDMVEKRLTLKSA